jgi:molybdopterin molybdotransferase
MVFALPGNPFSCLVTFKIFVEYYIKSSLGIENLSTAILPMNSERNKNSNLDEFFPVLADSIQLKPIAINGSGDIRLGNLANGLAIHPAEQKQLKNGTLISFLPI